MSTMGPRPLKRDLTVRSGLPPLKQVDYIYPAFPATLSLHDVSGVFSYRVSDHLNITRIVSIAHFILLSTVSVLIPNKARPQKSLKSRAGRGDQRSLLLASACQGSSSPLSCRFHES